MTFSLDEATATKIGEAARLHGLPKSGVVREAIADFHKRGSRISEEERIRKLAVLDEYMRMPPTRPQAEVTRELREIHRARRAGGRRHPAE